MTDYPPPLQQLVNSPHGFAETYVPFGYGKRMTDTLYGAGALVLPASYTKGALLTGSKDDPQFDLPAYNANNVANSSPDTIHPYLDAELASINAMWPDTKIVVVGHSNGGLIAFLWWLHSGQINPRGVVQALSLDAPINGEANPICTIVPDQCVAHGTIGKPLAEWFLFAWQSQAVLDPLYVKALAQSPLFTAIGSPDDPLYDAADYSPELDAAGFPNHIGIVSQVFYSEPGCATSGILGVAGFDLSSQSKCHIVGRSHIAFCGPGGAPMDDGDPPDFGLFTSNTELHSVIKNCPDAIGRAMDYVSPNTGIKAPPAP